MSVLSLVSQQNYLHEEVRQSSSSSDSLHLPPTVFVFLRQSSSSSDRLHPLRQSLSFSDSLRLGKNFQTAYKADTSRTTTISCTSTLTWALDCQPSDVTHLSNFLKQRRGKSFYITSQQLWHVCACSSARTV